MRMMQQSLDDSIVDERLEGNDDPAMGIERHPWSMFAALTILYFLAVACLSSLKLLWLDELITLHIASLKSAGAIWQALGRGVDPNPPVTYLLVHAARSLFGEHEFVYRLPAAIGYWVGMLSLFVFLKRRLPGVWPVAGTLLSMSMAAFDYSYESRSYGIFYGLAMLAFLCWALAVDESRSRWGRSCAFAGMILALAAGISTNYFAVLAFCPIAGAECVRTIRRFGAANNQGQSTTKRILRVIDLRIWIGFAVAISPLLVYRPLIERSIAQFAPYAWNKVSLGQVSNSYTEMVEIVLYPLLGLFGIAILVRLIAPQFESLCSACRERHLPVWLRRVGRGAMQRLPLPPEEAVGVLLFMAYPLLGYIIASIRGGMLSPRFVIPVCYGFACAGAVIAYQLFGGFKRAGLVFMVVMMAWFLCRESYVGYWYEEQKQCFYKIVDRIPEAEANLSANAPIVIPDPLLALTFEHYAPREYARRAEFPVDFPAIRSFRGDDSPEENLWAGRGFLYTLPIEPLATFQNRAGKYLVISSDFNWLLDDLRRHFYNVDRLPIVTRADAIGGFTPLARGTPVFFIARGDQASFVPRQPAPAEPTPFRAADNLPGVARMPDVEVHP